MSGCSVKPVTAQWVSRALTCSCLSRLTRSTGSAHFIQSITQHITHPSYNLMDISILVGYNDTFLVATNLVMNWDLTARTNNNWTWSAGNCAATYSNISGKDFKICLSPPISINTQPLYWLLYLQDITSTSQMYFNLHTNLMMRTEIVQFSNTLFLMTSYLCLRINILIIIFYDIFVHLTEARNLFTFECEWNDWNELMELWICVKG